MVAELSTILKLNSLTLQYSELLKVDNVDLNFSDDALKTISDLAEKENETNENLGARRLHSLLEILLEDISFNACGTHPMSQVNIDKAYVDNAFKETTKKYDLKKFIL